MREWPDKVLGAGGVLFALALWPSLHSDMKPAVATSLLNAVVLGAFVAADYALGLRRAAATTLLTCILWFILAVQAYG